MRNNNNNNNMSMNSNSGDNSDNDGQIIYLSLMRCSPATCQRARALLVGKRMLVRVWSDAVGWLVFCCCTTRSESICGKGGGNRISATKCCAQRARLVVSRCSDAPQRMDLIPADCVSSSSSLPVVFATRHKITARASASSLAHTHLALHSSCVTRAAARHSAASRRRRFVFYGCVD